MTNPTRCLMAVLILCVAATTLQAQVPSTIGHQGTLYADDGTPVSGVVSITFRLYDAQTAGTKLWEEAQDLSLENGVFSAVLGSVTALNLGFDQQYWLEMVVGGQTLTPRVKLTGTPYAYTAKALESGAEVQTLSAPDGLAVTGTYGSGSIPSTGAGARVMWYPKKAAFRAGRVDGDKWDDANIGDSSIGEGYNSLSSGAYSTVGGGFANSATGYSATAGGGTSSHATADYATVSGGGQNHATSQGATVAGGEMNQANGAKATVAGGLLNFANGDWSTVAGGTECMAAGDYSLAAGRRAKANHDGCFVWGDQTDADFASTAADQFLVRATGGFAAIGTYGSGDLPATGAGTRMMWYPKKAAFRVGAVAGDQWSDANTGTYSAVGGGLDNTSSGQYATVAGGQSNTASSSLTTVGGGSTNAATGSGCTVGGGANNTASTGSSTVSGGTNNTASGLYSAVPGGEYNEATGSYSFAAGRRAKANHSGVFVWADSENSDFASLTSNCFIVRATNGVRFFTDAALSAGVALGAGGGSWSTVSDSTLKRNLREVDYRAVLGTLSRVPIKRWSYLSQTPDIEHVGPTAQDFHAAFGLGETNTRISTIDPSGIALAAVKGLHQVVQEQEKRIAELKQKNSDLEARLESLERRWEMSSAGQTSGE
jgi:trimeric autotransporter adhesin